MAKWRPNSKLDRVEKRGRIGRRGRRTPVSADLVKEFESEESNWELNDGAFAARVVEVHKRYAFVSREDKVGEVDTSDVWLAQMTRKFLVAERVERNFIAVGDRVLCAPAKEGGTTKSDLPQCVIQKMSPRTSRIARKDPHTPELEHVLAANVDQVIIVASYKKPKLKWGLIDRYLVLAEQQGLASIIVINKSDLIEEDADKKQEEFKDKVALYHRLGYPLFVVQANHPSAAEASEIKDLARAMKDKISLLSGHSGVGKSSIINLFGPEIVQAVEPDDQIFYKGRHTTTFASFIKLRDGGFVIDTPGVRSFTFNELGAIDLSHAFVDLRPFLGQCQFRECRHLDEPGCIIREQVEAGKISEWRYRSYQAILLGASGREGRLRDMESL